MIADQDIDKGLLVLKIIWGAMLGSLGIYLFVGLLAAKNMPVSLNEATLSVLEGVFYTLTFITLIITRYVRRLILSAGGPDMQASQGYQSPVLQKYTTAMIIAWALSESIGIYGLLLFLLGKNTTNLYLLLLISAAAMMMYRPSKEEILSLSQASTSGTAAA